jgi:hypothetical protein
MKDLYCPSRQNKYFFTLQSCKTVERKNAKLQHVPHPGTFILISMYTCHASRILSFVNNSLRLNNCCIAPTVWSFLSTTAQLYATHRKSGKRRKRHCAKYTESRPCWRSLRQMRASSHAGRSDVIMAPPPPIVHVNKPNSVIFKKSG